MLTAEYTYLCIYIFSHTQHVVYLYFYNYMSFLVSSRRVFFLRGALHPGLLAQFLDVGAPLGAVLGESVEG